MDTLSMNSQTPFISLPLMPMSEGTASELASERLPLVFSSAVQIVIARESMTPKALVEATWGFSGLDPDRASVEIIDGGGDEWQDADWTDLTGVTKIRLGWLRWLLDNGKLTILKADLETLGKEDLLALSDSGGTMIVASLKEFPGSAEMSSYHLRFQWPFGDPSFRVKRLQEALLQLQRSPHPTLGGMLAKIEPVSPPFEEVFEDDSEPPLVPGFDLYEHQQKAVEAWTKNGERGLFGMYTGSGKTIAALAAVIRSCQARPAGQPLPPVIVVVPKKILADQWAEVIEEAFDTYVLKAFGGYQTWNSKIRRQLATTEEAVPNFIVTTYATFGGDHFPGALDRMKTDGKEIILIADEVHNVSSTRLIDRFRNFEALFQRRLGLSATPMIEGNETASRFLLDYFNEDLQNLDREDGSHQYCGVFTLEDGIANGVLCSYQYHPIPIYLDIESSKEYLDILARLEKRTGQNLLELYNRRRDILRKSSLPIDQLGLMLNNRGQKGLRCDKMLVYCPPGNMSMTSESDVTDDDNEFVNLLNLTNDKIRDAGLVPETIIGSTPERKRRDILARFKKGDFDCLTAIGCLDEGVDVPSIERAVILYSIDRYKQFVQRRGRILRRDRDNPDKVAEVIDMILLPSKEQLRSAQAQDLLRKEMRRYREFAELAANREEADSIISEALTQNSD